MLKPAKMIGKLRLSKKTLPKFSLQTLLIVPFLERDGLLVASSSQEQPFKIIDKKAERINSVNSSDILIRSTASYLQQTFGSFREIQQNQNLQFTQKGDRQFVHTAPW